MLNGVAALLPEGLASTVEAACGASIVAVKPRGGGGASREGAELTLRYADGREQRAYMNYDVLKAGAADDAAFARETAVLRALSGPLRASGVRTAEFIAAIPESRALIGAFVPGDADFNKLKSAAQRSATAQDFMAQLALLHSIDPKKHRIEGLGEIAPPSRSIREQISRLRDAHSASPQPHPLILLTLDWLERHVPEDPARITIVHGDAGPANFLYENNRVTALLDWELVHYGDPMEDLAMLCLRGLFQPFIALPDAFAMYEAAGGARVDLQRVRFYRLFFQTRFAASLVRLQDPDAPPPPVLGMSMVYAMTHLRVLNEALAEAMRVQLQPLTLPSAPPGVQHRSFEIALDDLRTAIVPRLADQQAAAKAKGLARLIKWWRDVQRFGPSFEALECAAYAQAFGCSFGSAQQARRSLCEAVQSRSIAEDTAIQLCHVSTYLDRALLADAMGALATAHFAPLE